MASTAQQQQFITANQAAALTAAQMITGSSSPDQLKSAQTAILSQWADESAWGTSSVAGKNFNLGGIECWSGCTCGADGKYCVYSNATDFAVGYAKFMMGSNYSAVRAAMQSGSVAQILQAIASSPYAAGHYGGGSDLQTIAGTVAGLLGVNLGSASPATPAQSATATGAEICTPPTGWTDVAGSLAYVQCSLLQDVKWAGVNFLTIALVILMVYLLIRDTSAGQYIIQAGKTAAKTATEAAVAA